MLVYQTLCHKIPDYLESRTPSIGSIHVSVMFGPGDMISCLLAALQAVAGLRARHLGRQVTLHVLTSWWHLVSTSQQQVKVEAWHKHFLEPRKSKTPGVWWFLNEFFAFAFFQCFSPTLRAWLFQFVVSNAWKSSYKSQISYMYNNISYMYNLRIWVS